MAAGPTDAAAPRSRRPRLALDLTLLALVGVLLVGAVTAAVAVLYEQFYSPSAFVERYLDTLAEGGAADALAMPGVALDSAELEAAGLPAEASDALLRRAALATLTDIHIVSATTGEDGITSVTAAYSAGPYPGTTTFRVERDGMIGVAPTWRFATSPLAVIDLTVRGSMSFQVNGFEVDKRQVSPDGVDADPLASLALLAFSPGIYSVSVDSAISSSPGVAVLSDSPMKATPIEVQAAATDKFVAVVQSRVEEFLTDCATQDVLLPTACPFGYQVEDRIVSPPVWAIAQQPTVTLTPDGAGWKIPETEATAHIEVDIRSLFDGSIRHVSEDVPFLMTGTITVLPNGSASIVVDSTDPR
ncbi:hypothetical protein [Microbacterium sp. P5_E9]